MVRRWTAANFELYSHHSLSASTSARPGLNGVSAIWPQWDWWAHGAELPASGDGLDGAWVLTELPAELCQRALRLFFVKKPPPPRPRQSTNARGKLA